MEFYAKWPSFGLSIISSIDLQGGGGFPSQIVELELVSLQRVLLFQIGTVKPPGFLNCY